MPSAVAGDRRPPGSITAAAVVCAPYVDDANIVGMRRDVVQDAIKKVVTELDLLGFGLRDLVEGESQFDMVGLHLDGPARILRHLQRRTWRLILALRCLRGRRACSPAQMRCVVGHLTHHFLLSRPALAVLGEVYMFMGAEEEYFWLPGKVLAELKVAEGLLPLCAASLARPVYPHLYCSDSSSKGYAFDVAVVPSLELRRRRALQYRERWWFADVADPEPLRLARPR